VVTQLTDYLSGAG